MVAIYDNDQRGRAVDQVSFDNDDSVYRTIMSKTACIAQAFFTFRDSADGEFFVATKVEWMVCFNLIGGPLMQRVRVSGGKTEETVLAP